MPKLPANVRKHGKQYIFRVRVNGETIVRQLGEDEAEARRLGKLFREEVLRGRLTKVKPSGTVAEFAETWLKTYVPRHRRELDHEMAKVRMENYILPILGKCHLSQVRRRHLEGLVNSLETRKGLSGKPLSVSTQRAILSDCRCMFSWAVDQEVIDHSPFSGRRILPKLVKRAPQPLTDLELARIIQVCPEPYRSAIIFAERTGLRWSEQLNLPWRNVDLTERSITVDHTKDGKWRRIPLDAKAVKILRQWQKKTKGQEFVMPWRPAFPNWPPRFTRKLEDRPVFWHWHQLRHTAACRWLREGLAIVVVSKLLGHSSVTTTEIYAGLFEDTVRAEFERIGERKVGQKLAKQGS